MTIISIDRVRAAVERAVNLGGTLDEAIATVALALHLSEHQVREAAHQSEDQSA